MTTRATTKFVFSRRLEAARSRDGYGLTQKQLSEKSLVPLASISKYENEGRLPDCITLVKLALALDVSVDYLLGLDNVEA